jgi:uncharacterized protein (UPF0332 family)
MVRDEPKFDTDLRTFLGRTYNLKAIADYATGEAEVTSEEAQHAIDSASRFIDAVEVLLT